jgi:nuclear transport factor 2 (NTF2) superfamily protein
VICAYGNNKWEFDNQSYFWFRIASIDDLSIKEAERTFHWPLGRWPDEHPGFLDLEL